MRKLLKIGVGLIVLGLLGGASWFWYHKQVPQVFVYDRSR